MNEHLTRTSFYCAIFMTLLIGITTAALLEPLMAHPGGRDAYGCHHDRKHGGYHCHAGPLAGQSFASQAEMLAVSQGDTANVAPATPKERTTSATLPIGDVRTGQLCIREHRTQQIMCGEPVR